MRGAVLAAVAGGLLLLPAAGAEVQPPLAVQITTVRATDDGTCDPQLEGMRPRLRRLVGYRGYQLLGDEQTSCGVARARRSSIWARGDRCCSCRRACTTNAS